jgi:cobalt/nickel transport system permease protein
MAHQEEENGGRRLSIGHGHWAGIQRVEDLAAGSSAFHRVDPVAKLLVTLGFTGVVSSFPAAAVTPLAPYLIYPVLCAAVGGIPPRLLFSRILAVLPLAVFLGIANPILDHAPAMVLGGMVVSRGWLSLIGIVCRTLLVVAGALCLTALTGFDGICRALERLRLPRILVLQLRLMFRHLSTLSDEVSRTLLAYRLRSGRKRGVAPGEWGGVAGGVLVRTVDRAERIHLGMVARGGTAPPPGSARSPLRAWDWVFLIAWGAWFALCRVVDVPSMVGALVQVGLHV